MHSSAMMRMAWFVDNYIPREKDSSVLDVGSYSVNGNYRSLFRGMRATYTGLDISAGPNVDVVVSDPYKWKELKDNSFDFVISGNAFEHIEYPWLTLQQIYSKLKDGGVVCILTPFNLSEHRYPIDCYRYYPDGMIALAKWAGFKIIDCTTGGLPKDTPLSWLGDQNYDDTMLIAIKSTEDIDLSYYPKLVQTVRSCTIYQGG